MNYEKADNTNISRHFHLVTQKKDKGQKSDTKQTRLFFPTRRTTVNQYHNLIGLNSIWESLRPQAAAIPSCDSRVVCQGWVEVTRDMARRMARHLPRQYLAL